MKKRRLVWIILLVVGIFPYTVPLFFGIFSSINGFSGLCLWGCNYYYGFPALVDSIYLYSSLFWPTYILGIILIIISIIKLKNFKN